MEVNVVHFFIVITSEGHFSHVLYVIMFITVIILCTYMCFPACLISLLLFVKINCLSLTDLVAQLVVPLPAKLKLVGSIPTRDEDLAA